MTEHRHEAAAPAAAAAPDVEAVFLHDDALADEMEEESFPGSDPPSTWAGHDRPTADDA